MVINKQKYTDVRPMLIKFFSTCSCVDKEILERNVDNDTLNICMEEEFLRLAKNKFNTYQYVITQSGKEYRDSKE